MSDSTERTPKVLIVAPNASSRFGGESFLPLQYFRLLRERGYPVRLVTHSRNRSDLEATLPDHIDDISFIMDTAAHRAVWRLGSRLPQALREYGVGTILLMLDRIQLAGIIRDLVRKGSVDLIHQPTPVSALAPSSLHRFGVPLIVGPMNGGMNYPPGYEDLEGPMARRFVAWSRRLAWMLNRLVPGKRMAAVLLVANERTRAALPFAGHTDVRYLVENAVDLRTWSMRSPVRGEEASAEVAPGRLRLVFMGRLIPLKMVDLTMEAVSRSREAGAEVTLDILGDGPERPRLEELAQSMRLGGVVSFHGYLPQSECASFLMRSDALVLNSVRECGGAVVLEAMALGLPVIAADWGGPADYLDERCGILVSPTPRDTFAARLADAMCRLAQSPQLRKRLGAAGASKVAEQYNWGDKVDRMVALYEEVAARTRSDRA